MPILNRNNKADYLEELIKERRNTKFFKNKLIDKQLLLKVIEMGIWAPNHRMTEPWTFVVVSKGSEERKKIGNQIEKLANTLALNKNKETVKKSAKKARMDFTNCPCIVYVFSKTGKNEEETTENFSSVSISIQNMSLYAWSLGIGIGWSTGKTVKVSNLYNILRVPKSSKIVGCLSMGYIIKKPEILPTRRSSHLDKIIWK